MGSSRLLQVDEPVTSAHGSSASHQSSAPQKRTPAHVELLTSRLTLRTDTCNLRLGITKLNEGVCY